MKVLVTGAKGQLGFDVVMELEKQNISCLGVDINDFDITDEQQVSSFINSYAPDVVVHCAAYTDVERAEDEQDLCHKINVNGTRFVAKACAKLKSTMLYISTDYVFDGSGIVPFETNSPTDPLNVYGQTKLEGELAVKEQLSHYFILRISWVFGKNGKNFVKTMQRLSGNTVNVVSDQIGSPTYTKDLSPLIVEMINSEKYGTYHATNEGSCSWAEFAEEIFLYTKQNTKVNPITTKMYQTKADRPNNSLLSKNSLDQNGFSRLPYWKDALQRFLNELK